MSELLATKYNYTLKKLKTYDYVGNKRTPYYTLANATVPSRLLFVMIIKAESRSKKTAGEGVRFWT